MYLTIIQSTSFRLFLAYLFGLLLCTQATGQTDSMPGIVLARKSAQLSTGVTQVLEDVKVEPGQWVKKGQLLASLDSKIAKAEYASAYALASSGATVELARIDVREAKARLNRFKDAYQRGAANAMEIKKATNDYNRSVAALQVAKDAMEQATQQAELARQRLELYYIRAPFDGLVDRILMRPGNLVASDTPVVSLIASQELQVELFLPINRFGELEVGKSYPLQAAAPLNQTIQAKLKYASPNVDSASGTFYCLFEIDNQNRKLPSGFSVYLPSAGEQFVSSE